jgi:hypothetical protein
MNPIVQLYFVAYLNPVVGKGGFYLISKFCARFIKGFIHKLLKIVYAESMQNATKKQGRVDTMRNTSELNGNSLDCNLFFNIELCSLCSILCSKKKLKIT